MKRVEYFDFQDENIYKMMKLESLFQKNKQLENDTIKILIQYKYSTNRELLVNFHTKSIKNTTEQQIEKKQTTAR